MDIGLPGMTGYEVARRIRQQPQAGNPLLVAVTGYAEDEARRLSREAGFDHHLVKPSIPTSFSPFWDRLSGPRKASDPAARPVRQPPERLLRP